MEGALLRVPEQGEDPIGISRSKRPGPKVGEIEGEGSCP